MTRDHIPFLLLACCLVFTSAGFAEEAQQVVLPEVATEVRISSSDVNRIVCSAAPIKDAVSSTEKGINIKIQGSNAFVKLAISKKDGNEIYRTDPVELFVICGENVYNLIAIPQRIPSQTIRLSSGRADSLKKNISLFEGMPLEKKIVFLIKSAYTENIPDSFSIIPSNKRFDLFRDLSLTLRRTVVVEGEGLQLKEYIAEIKTDLAMLELNERDFLKTELTTQSLAISIDRLSLKKGDTARVFIVERSKDERSN